MRPLILFVTESLLFRQRTMNLAVGGNGLAAGPLAEISAAVEMLLGQVSSDELIRFPIEHAARRFIEISGNMQNYALKRYALRALTRKSRTYLRGLFLGEEEKGVLSPPETYAHSSLQGRSNGSNALNLFSFYPTFFLTIKQMHGTCMAIQM